MHAQGIEGRYIEYDTAYTPEDDYERLQGAHFVVNGDLGEAVALPPPLPRLNSPSLPPTDPRIATLVQRFLPLATYYTGVTAFVQEYSVLEHGTVNHALCAAIREMLRVR